MTALLPSACTTVPIDALMPGGAYRHAASRPSEHRSAPASTAAQVVAPDAGRQEDGSSGVTAAASAPPAPSPAAASAAVVALSPAAKTIEFAILEDYDKGQDLADVEKDFRLFDELGVRVWRGSLGWDDFEPERGHYDFEWLDRFVTLASSHGLTLRPYIASTPGWAAAGRTYDEAVWNDPPGQIDDWRAFVRALATRLETHPNIASYEIYNQENVSMWWDGSAAEYNEVLAAASEELRAAAPGKQIVLGGMVWPDESWVDAVCKENGNAGAFDVIAFHAYPETWTKPEVHVENYLDDLYREQFLAAVRDCGRKTVWINEAGFATRDQSAASEREQARWWVRAVATFAAAPEITQIGVYEIKDSSRESNAIGGEPSYHLGLLRADRSPKPAFYAVRLLVALLGNQPIEVLDQDVSARPRDGSTVPVYLHAFLRADGSRVVIVWAAGDTTVDIAVPTRGEMRDARAVSYGLDGAPAPVQDFAAGVLRNVRIAPDDARVFVIGG